MTPAELTALAERVEAATWADRELADQVLLACGWRLNHAADEIAGWRVDPGVVEGEDGSDYPVTFADRMEWACWYKPGNRPFRDSWIDGHYRPNPLASLDAAMTLVPEGCGWELIYRKALENYAASVKTEGQYSICPASTPALALTAACLRARAAMQEASDALRF
jgi:hypothetical protein